MKFDKVIFDEVIFDEVIFDQVIFDEVIFDKVIFDKVIFDEVSYPRQTRRRFYWIVFEFAAATQKSNKKFVLMTLFMNPTKTKTMGFLKLLQSFFLLYFCSKIMLHVITLDKTITDHIIQM